MLSLVAKTPRLWMNVGQGQTKCRRQPTLEVTEAAFYGGCMSRRPHVTETACLEGRMSRRPHVTEAARHGGCVSWYNITLNIFGLLISSSNHYQSSVITILAQCLLSYEVRGHWWSEVTGGRIRDCTLSICLQNPIRVRYLICKSSVATATSLIFNNLMLFILFI